MGKVVVPDQYKEEDVQRALDLLEKNRLQREKSKARMSDPAYQAQMKEKYARKRAEERILIFKAKQAGLTADTQEIDNWLAANK